MKKLILILLFALNFAGVSAQAPRKFDPKRFDVEMQQFITTEAGLTPKEAAAFFPLFEEMQKKQRVYFDKMRKYRFVDTGNDEACLKAIKEMDEIDLQIKKIQRDYHLKFCDVLPPSKVFKVLKADEKFHRQAFKRMVKKAPR